jgi:parallel beta-helix repeat protein
LINSVNILKTGTSICNLKLWILLGALFSVSLSSFSQEAFISGVMTTDRTWYSDTTYIVYQDFVVPNGVVLTINAGTTIKIRYGIEFIVDAGILRVNGTEEDSVKFLPHHTNPGHLWKWSGLSILNSGVENEINISYAQIIDAETAIMLEYSRNVLIENSSIMNCQNLGIYMANSSYCYIVSTRIESNYNGIELYADFLGSTSNNIILDCIITNENHNIYIYREEGGVYQNNIISGNIISSGNNGIWIDNNGGSVNSENIIERNIIANNGSDVGYGLLLAHDSTIVSNNIFWKNDIAIYSEDQGDNSSILNNSFYHNDIAIAIGAGSENNKYLNNTFSINSNELLGIKETINNSFNGNNILNNYGMHDIIVNNTTDEISIMDNYWGTTDTSEINQLIFDHYDDPEKGIVNYQPLLASVDTSNPISPPYMVKKQLINNELVISWYSNPEGDLVRYNMYYGEFENYSFPRVIELNLDTVYYFKTDISINDDISITAVDSHDINPDSKLDGHESPFSFAVLYPYAGNDTILCQNQEKLEIYNSNVPYFYQSIQWTTNGDGEFDNSELLNPKYYPGVGDIENGSVGLSIVVQSSEGVRSDTFILTIVDDPIAFAGNDTIVFVDSDIVLEGASASNFNEIFWETNGDGQFDNESLVNPIYYPGNGDIEVGVVYLKITSISDCGIASDSIRVFIEPYFSIEGKLWVNGKSQFYDGAIVAFHESSSGARAAHFELTQSDGTFKFNKVMMGNYYIYALPDTNNFENAVPGYYANKMRWQSAYLLPVYEDVYDIDILLFSLEKNIPFGEGGISGHMVLPVGSDFIEEIYCKPWFDNSSDLFCNGGLSNSTILLFNSDKSKLLDYTLTNSIGDFYFKDLPYGNYIVDAEKAGYSTISSSIIVLSPDNKDETGVILEIRNNKIGITTLNPVSSMDNIVYPNPAYNVININTENITMEVSGIEIFNILGTRVFKGDTEISSSSNIITLNISSLSPGIYYGKLHNSSLNNYLLFRFIIKDN